MKAFFLTPSMSLFSSILYFSILFARPLSGKMKFRPPLSLSAEFVCHFCVCAHGTRSSAWTAETLGAHFAVLTFRPEAPAQGDLGHFLLKYRGLFIISPSAFLSRILANAPPSYQPLLPGLRTAFESGVKKKADEIPRREMHQRF